MSTSSQPAPELHPNEVSDSSVTFLGIVAMMLFLSTVSVILRFVSRSLAVRFWWDDWVILAALVFSWGAAVCCVLIATVGAAGYHISTYPLWQIEVFLKIDLGLNILYNASVTSAKISILLFYRRMFPIQSSIRLWMRIMGGIVIAYFLAAVLGLVFSYNPVEAQWKFWLPHTNINIVAFWLTMGVINALIDVTILAIPQSRVWKLQMDTRRKILVSLVFLLGTFVCITSIIRIVFLYNIDLNDVTWSLTPSGIWTMIELNSSIICACLPVLPSLFKRKRVESSRRTISPESKTSHTRSLLKPRGNDSCDLELRPELGHHTSIEAIYDQRRQGRESYGPVHVRKDFIVE
ncbi:hypothetical protein F4810DRAFT_679744 [Camillea tinctor]|nr:hypothetical protein F4810DRAFT_679744 [Camillea tinctor]